MLSERLGIKKGITSVIGGGGKTSLIFNLAAELRNKGTVLIATTTKMLEPQIMPLATSIEDVNDLIENRGVAVAGTRMANGKITKPLFGNWQNLADYVLVEADGSRHLPVKAHDVHEPCVPENSQKTILVIGNHAFMRPIATVAHRPELYAQLASVSTSSLVTPEIAFHVIEKENLHDLVIINTSIDTSDYFKSFDIRNIKYPVYFESIPKQKY